MNSKKVLGFVGAALLMIGTLTPVVGFSDGSWRTYFGVETKSAILAMLIGYTSLVKIVKGKFMWLWALGPFALVVVGLGYATISNQISREESEIAEITDVGKYESPELLWGWFVLFLGAILITACAASKDKIS